MHGPPDEKGRPLQGRPRAFQWQEMQRSQYQSSVDDARRRADLCSLKYGFVAGLHEWTKRHPEYARHPIVVMMLGDAVEDFSIDYAALPPMGPLQ